MIKPVIIVPCFNHADAFNNIASSLADFKIPLIVVDDGSSDKQATKIKNICKKHNFLYIRNEKNGGKGAAMITGFKYAMTKGFSHALQIDADGQHEIKDIPLFIKTAEFHPNDLIVGNPEYDDSAPKSRLIGRKITRFWVAIETLKLNMPDTMCGFRVYPLKAIAPILENLRFKRMGYDIEILVKAFRHGVKLIPISTRVVYPENGVSHFHVFRDNFFISCMHAYLCCLIPFWLFSKMFKHKKITSVVLGTLLAFDCMAQPLSDKTPEKLQKFVDNLNTVSATFVQTKILPESTKKFITNGRVKFAKGVGFIWQQQKPNETTFISTLDKYCINGEAKELNELPYFYQIQQMIDNMLNGDLSDFLYAFQAEYQEDKKGWNIIATPKISGLSDIVQDLTIYGTVSDITKMIMTYADGTIVILDFKRMTKDFSDEIAC